MKEPQPKTKTFKPFPLYYIGTDNSPEKKNRTVENKTIYPIAIYPLIHTYGHKKASLHFRIKKSEANLDSLKINQMQGTLPIHLSNQYKKILEDSNQEFLHENLRSAVLQQAIDTLKNNIDNLNITFNTLETELFTELETLYRQFGWIFETRILKASVIFFYQEVKEIYQIKMNNDAKTKETKALKLLEAKEKKATEQPPPDIISTATINKLLSKIDTLTKRVNTLTMTSKNKQGLKKKSTSKKTSTTNPQKKKASPISVKRKGQGKK
ncbi:hypothetical protein HDV02_006575 [Globomyces sp. JEL0801]|nr:hypothetical protein HDV02_006575 [Globomyces sp. JEL0801]